MHYTFSETLSSANFRGVRGREKGRTEGFVVDIVGPVQVEVVWVRATTEQDQSQSGSHWR